MARSTVVPVAILLSLLSLNSVIENVLVGAVSIPAGSDRNGKRDTALSLDGNPNFALSPNMTSWYYVSGDGSQIVPIKASGEKPAGLTGASNGGHSYEFGFGNWHGTLTPQPGLAKYLFECEFGLFGQVPASGLGVWTPYPRGRYVCNNGQLPGMIRVDLDDNDIEYKMAYHDLAFVLKVLHDTEGVKQAAPFFDFHVNYTPDTDVGPPKTVMHGSWVNAVRGVASSE